MSSRKDRPVRIDEQLHEELKEMQREFREKQGVEPALGDLIEMAFTEELSDELEKQDDSVWDEEFMKL